METLKITCLKNGKTYSKDIKKEAIYAVFNGLYQGFEDDNKISKMLIERIPDVDTIIINQDINETQDVPFIIICANNNTEMIKILRYHKIVWSILNRYCTEAMTQE